MIMSRLGGIINALLLSWPGLGFLSMINHHDIIIHVDMLPAGQLC